MATIHWIGQFGNWTTTSDWNPNQVPGPSDDAVIDAAGGYTVTINTPITVNSIAVNNGSVTLTVNDPGQTDTVTAGLSDSGALLVDNGNGQGGTTLNIGGTLSSGNFGLVQIGNSTLGAATSVSAAAFTQPTNATLNIIGSASKQATFDITGPAGFGTAGALDGRIFLGGDALLEFGSGQITTIANSNGNPLTLDGPGARIADATGSALTGLTSIAGALVLDNGASIAPSGNLSVTGELHVDDRNGQGGTSLPIGGTLSLGSFAFVQIGNSNLSVPATVSAASMGSVATNATLNIIGSAGTQATLSIAGPAGFGTAGTIDGRVFLGGDALLEFGSGQITTIANSNGNPLTLDGPGARIADASDTTSNSALTGLASIAGSLVLDNGAIIAPSGNLSVSGELHVDDSGGQGGTTLPITGTLTNSGFIQIGNNSLSATTNLIASAVSNTGTINLIGSATKQATLSITSAPAILTGGTINLSGDAALLYGSGQIADIASGRLSLSGSQAHVADASDPTHNSALAGLGYLAGELDLQYGQTLAVNDALLVSGTLSVDTANAAGGSSVTIAGILSNTGTVNIGTNGGGGNLSSSTSVSAAGLNNLGTINIEGNTAANATARATLNIAAAAPMAWTGTANLTGDALLEFASGGIGSIGSGAQINFSGAQARVADSGTPDTSSALTGLSNVVGELGLASGASLALGGSLAVSGTLNLDFARLQSGRRRPEHRRRPRQFRHGQRGYLGRGGRRYAHPHRRAGEQRHDQHRHGRRQPERADHGERCRPEQYRHNQHRGQHRRQYERAGDAEHCRRGAGHVDRNRQPHRRCPHRVRQRGDHEHRQRGSARPLRHQGAGSR